MGGEVVAQGAQAGRAELELFERRGERDESVPVGRGGVEEPALLLGLVVLLVREVQVAAGALHLLRERARGGCDLLLFQIAEDLLPVDDRVGVAQRRVEERLERVLVAAGDDRLDGLVEVEVAEELRFHRGVWRVGSVRKEDALEPAIGRGWWCVQLRVKAFGAGHRLPSRRVRR